MKYSDNKVHTRKSELSGVYFADSLPGCCSGYKTV